MIQHSLRFGAKETLGVVPRKPWVMPRNISFFFPFPLLNSQQIQPLQTHTSFVTLFSQKTVTQVCRMYTTRDQYNQTHKLQIKSLTEHVQCDARQPKQFKEKIERQENKI